MDKKSALLGSTPPGPTSQRVGIALLRALRTLLQGIAAALPTAGFGSAVFSTSYWVTLAYSLIGAVATALVSLCQNLAMFLPADPTQVVPLRPPHLGEAGAVVPAAVGQ